jgi:hypothetical protein
MKQILFPKCIFRKSRVSDMVKQKRTNTPEFFTPGIRQFSNLCLLHKQWKYTCKITLTTLYGEVTILCYLYECVRLGPLETKNLEAALENCPPCIHFVACFIVFMNEMLHVIKG